MRIEVMQVCPLHASIGRGMRRAFRYIFGFRNVLRSCPKDLTAVALQVAFASLKAISCICFLSFLLVSESRFCFASANSIACPFCGAIGATLTEEVDSSKVAGLAICTKVTVPKNAKELTKATFRFVEVLKGKEYLLEDEYSVVCFDPVNNGDQALLLAFDCEPLEFGSPVLLDEAAFEYASKVFKLTQDKDARLLFFYHNLLSRSKFVSDDAYNEFGKATYADVTSLRPHLELDVVKSIIRDPNSSSSIRSLYWTFLSICGSREEARFFHEMLDSDLYQKTFNPGLDAAIACYISLVGEEALKEVENKYIVPTDVKFGAVFSAILAIRAQVDEMKGLPKERLASSLYPLLTRVEFADQVIPDLARWEDWRAVNELGKLFAIVEPEHSQIRDHILRYLSVCPNQDAKSLYEKLAKLDPEAARRSRMLFGKAPYQP